MGAVARSLGKRFLGPGALPTQMPVRTAVFALSAGLLALALAGCFGGDGGDRTPATTSRTGTPSSGGPLVGGCRLEAHDVPARVAVNETFQVDVTPECGFQWESQHVAAHYASARSASPSLSAYPNACSVHPEKAAGPHQSVNCTIARAGTYYLRGHAQVANGGQTQDLWSIEFVVVAGPAPTPMVGAPSVRAFDVPSTAKAGRAFAFNVTVAWGSVLGAKSNHMGAHSWTSSQANPQVAGAGSCSHVTENRTLPQRLSTSCTGTQAGTLYVRGHARIENGGSLQDYWSDEVPVVIE